VQPLIAKNAYGDGPHGALEAATDWRSGNTDLFLLSGNVLASYRRDRHLLFLFGRGEYGSKGSERFASSDLEHLRYRVVVHPPFELEAFAQHDRDEFRRMALRALAGAGPRLHVVESKPMDLAFGVAYLFEYEKLASGHEADSGEVQHNHRLSSYGSLILRVTETLALAYTLYVQPRLDDFADVRVLSDTELAVTVVPHVALKIALTLTYDSEPPISVKQTDGIRKAMIQLSF
jgi:hypothetical protein